MSILINSISLSSIPIPFTSCTPQPYNHFTQFTIEISFNEDDTKNIRLEKVKNSIESIKKLDKSLEIYFLNSDGHARCDVMPYYILNKQYLKDDNTSDIILKYAITKIFEDKITLIFSYDSQINE